MRKPASTPIVLILALGAAPVLGAQSRPAQPIAPIAQGSRAAASAESTQKRVEPYVSVTGVYDSNIDRDQRNRGSVGGVFGAGVLFRTNRVDPALEVHGEVAGHSYSNSGRWDRFSQKLDASWQHDLPGDWKFDATGEISLKGSTEDREISDQYAVIPRFAYRIDSQTRVRIYGALRARRYEDDELRNGVNRYVGVEFTRRETPDRRWELDARYEVNEAESLRQHYGRWTFSAGYAFQLFGSDRVEVAVRYRMRRYPFRLVEVDGTDVQRRDHWWIPQVTWTRPLSPGLHLRTGYTCERRTSNATGREFTSHLVSVTIIRYWRRAAGPGEDR